MLVPDSVSPEALPIVLTGALILAALVVRNGWWRP